MQEHASRFASEQRRMENSNAGQTTPTLSVVVPAYNEEQVLEEFHRRLLDTLIKIPANFEILYINDGSDDHTLEIMRALPPGPGALRIVDLSRNFGKEIAMTAGLDHANGDAVVVIDADLQDPPETITDLFKVWITGCDVVYAKRASRNGETAVKKLTAKMFYRFMQRLGGTVKIPEDTGDFRLMSRRAVDALSELREQHRFMKGLFTWIGFKQQSVLYNRDERFAGETKWNYWKLWNFSLEGITSFTTIPLRMATYMGILTAFFSLGFGSYIVGKALVFGDPVPGFPSLIAIVTFLGGVQLLTLGIIGEYLGRTFNEVKNRPLYFIQEHLSIEANPEQQNDSYRST